MKHSDYGLNLKAKAKQIWRGETVSTLDELKDYDPQIPEPLITAQIEIKAKEDLHIDYTLGNKHYGKELI